MISFHINMHKLLKKAKFIKNYLVVAFAVIILGASLFYLKFDLPGTSSEAQLVINFENGESRKFKGPVMSEMTILKALYSSSLASGLEVRYSIQDGGGVSLAKIDGAINYGHGTWHFYLNSEPVNAIDIDKVKIRAGDLIEVKYE